MQKQLLTILASGTLLLNALAPMALADSNLQVSGNGAGSDNNVNASSNTTSTVVQSNDAHINNNVQTNATTGGNDANENTGGDVTIDTGNARNTTDISTKANANIADLGNCNCNNGGDSSVSVSGNGANSDNHVNLDANHDTSLFQNNSAWVTNDVSSNAKTGHNDANRNTGGDVLVLTGHASNDTELNTAANANVARLGSDGGSGNSAGSDVRITGNGAGSDNNVDLNHDRSITLVQDNDAHVRNNVDANATTGHNRANENTGGDVTIDTGNAANATDVRTLANFNSADLGNCGCLTEDVFGKISGNGAHSDNNITHRASDDLSVFQNGNTADITNDVDSNSRTGKNDAKRNTGDVSSAIDPVDVITGHATSDTRVQNKANVNVFGPDGVHLPGGNDLHFTFDMNGLLGSLHL